MELIERKMYMIVVVRIKRTAKYRINQGIQVSFLFHAFIIHLHDIQLIQESGDPSFIALIMQWENGYGCVSLYYLLLCCFVATCESEPTLTRMVISQYSVPPDKYVSCFLQMWDLIVPTAYSTLKIVFKHLHEYYPFEFILFVKI